MTSVAAPSHRPATVTVEDAATELGISRGLAYKLAKEMKLPGVIKLGSRYVVSRSVLDRVMNGEQST